MVTKKFTMTGGASLETSLARFTAQGPAASPWPVEQDGDIGSDRGSLNTGTSEMRGPHRFDVDRLERWAKETIPGFSGPLSVAQFRGGQSNPTYRLETPSQCYVLRRKPPGPILTGAHAVEREYQVVSALAGAGFPVPRTYALCLDESVVGTPFYVMEMVEGRIFWDAGLPEIERNDRAAFFDAMNRTIAALHAIDPGSIGLANFGRPGNYFGRQIARWSKQYLGDAEAGRVGALDRLVEWLPANLPPDEPQPRIIHGDFRCDNMIFHRARPEVLAVIDWELSTLGHPLADFTYHLMMYRMPRGVGTGLGGLDLAALGIPGEQAYIDDYCRRTGRKGIPHLDFYMAFNLFRLAAIVHGIKGRLIRGNASSAEAGRMVRNLEPLADLAWQQAVLAGAA